MRIKLKDIKDLLWNKYSETVYLPGGCSTCGDIPENFIDDEGFELLLEEIDSWIEKNYDTGQQCK